MMLSFPDKDIVRYTLLATGRTFDGGLEARGNYLALHICTALTGAVYLTAVFFFSSRPPPPPDLDTQPHKLHCHSTAGGVSGDLTDYQSTWCHNTILRTNNITTTHLCDLDNSTPFNGGNSLNKMKVFANFLKY